MSKEQKQGAILFFAHNCKNCHTGPALNSMEFHAYGLNDLENGTQVFNVDPTNGAHLGRGGFTGVESENYKFKVPQLYNLKDSPFLGHGSSFNSVYDIVSYKNKGVSQNPNVPDSHLAEEFEPLNLAEYEIELIVDFIENALYDPNLMRYTPTSLPSGNCFPNNDTFSQADLEWGIADFLVGGILLFSVTLGVQLLWHSTISDKYKLISYPIKKSLRSYIVYLRI